MSQRSFDSLTASIGPARRFVRQGAESVVSDPACLDDIELAASELVSNAIEHGSGDHFRVDLSIDDEQFVLEVESSFAGSPLTDPSEWTTPSADATSGRGLSLIKAVSAEVWVEHADGSLTIGCRFDSK